MDKYYLIYKITNLINEKYYIGVHETYDREDNYMGSGINIKRAIKKYGINNFKKEIISVLTNKDDMFLKEKEIISSCIPDENCYNITMGGDGSFYHINMDEQRHHISKDDIVKYIKKSELSLYLENGWVMGNIKTSKALTGRKLSKKHIDKLSQCNRNTVFIFKENETKRVSLDEYEQKYKDFGWIRGNPKLSKALRELKLDRRKEKNGCYGKKTIFNEKLNKNKRVYPNEIDEYIKNGWVLGFKFKFNKDAHKNRIYPLRKRLHHKKLNIQKSIKIEEVDTFLNNGWEFGNLPEYNNKRNKENHPCYGKINIHNILKNICKKVNKEELEEYIKNGWCVGGLRTKK